MKSKKGSNEMTKGFAKQSNRLIEARYTMTPIEKRLLYLVLVRVREGDNSGTVYRIPWDTFLLVSSGALNTKVKINEFFTKLKNKTIIFDLGAKAGAGFGFIAEWKFSIGSHVDVMLPKGMIRLLVDLKNGHYTKVEIDCMLSLRSFYSMRIYEVLKSRLYQKGKVPITLDELRHYFDLVDVPRKSEYNYIADILKRSQKDLKRHTDITFTFEPVKVSRKTVSVKFLIKHNPNYQHTLDGFMLAEDAIDAEKVELSVKNGDMFEWSQGANTWSGTVPEFGEIGGVYFQDTEGNNNFMPLAQVRKGLQDGDIKRVNK